MDRGAWQAAVHGVTKSQTDWVTLIWSIFHHIYHICGYLGCLNFLAIVNNDIMNMVCIYLFMLMFLFSLNKYPEVELLNPVVVLILEGSFLLCT